MADRNYIMPPLRLVQRIRVVILHGPDNVAFVYIIKGPLDRRWIGNSTLTEQCSAGERGAPQIPSIRTFLVSCLRLTLKATVTHC